MSDDFIDLVGTPLLNPLLDGIIARQYRMQSQSERRGEIAIQQGHDLLKLKELSPHGEFQHLVARLPISYSTATDYMKLARTAKVGRRSAQGLGSVRKALAQIEYKAKPIPQTARDKLRAIVKESDRVPQSQPQLLHGDCLSMMSDIPDESIDLILTDLPTGAARLDWDVPLDLDRLWQHYRRIIRTNCPIVLFACQPYATDLLVSNRGMYRYEWVWVKSHVTGFVHAKSRPLRRHENILVFSEGTSITPVRSERAMPFYPKTRPATDKRIKNVYRQTSSAGYVGNNVHGMYVQQQTGYPDTVLDFPSDRLLLHPTEKPIRLLEFLISLYTQPGDVVLDSCMGAGSTGIACAMSGRRFIGIEENLVFFERARQALTSIAA